MILQQWKKLNIVTKMFLYTTMHNVNTFLTFTTYKSKNSYMYINTEWCDYCFGALTQPLAHQQTRAVIESYSIRGCNNLTDIHITNT